MYCLKHVKEFLKAKKKSVGFMMYSMKKIDGDGNK